MLSCLDTLAQISEIKAEQIAGGREGGASGNIHRLTFAVLGGQAVEDARFLQHTTTHLLKVQTPKPTAK